MNQPLKRHPALQPWSREHHYGLLLSWKIKRGFALNVDPQRIKDYCDWFWKYHLQPHFETEENHLFPILGHENHLIEQALDDHGQLKAMFEQTEADTDTLSQIESLLNDNIRFEERVLFNAIQDVATKSELERLEEVHENGLSCETWSDEFWKQK